MRPSLVCCAFLCSITRGQTIKSRGLESTASSLPSDESFAFDGTNSDIAQQLYIRHKAGGSGDVVTLDAVPTAVIDRLEPLNIKFEELPGLVQRALLWDTGFGLSPENDAVQIWPMEDYTMADIAVPKADVQDANCTFKNCSQPNEVTAYYTLICSGDQMLSVSRCVVDTFEDDGAIDFLGAMWSRGGDPDMTPQIRLRNHAWTDPVSNDSFSVFAVHTVPNALDAAWNQCPANDGYASLAVPCHRRDEFTDDEMAGMTKPVGSAWVTSWLEQEFAEDSGLNTMVLVLIVAGAVVLLLVAGVGWCCWRRRSSSKAPQPASAACDLDLVSPKYLGGATPELACRPSTVSNRPTAQSSLFNHSHSGDFESAGSNRTLKILLDSPQLQGRRVPYESLAFDRPISKGASGEVWVCNYNGQQVAVKRLIQGNQKAENFEAFAEEIELSASLVHPNIVEFVGVAWNSLNNLAMVLEFFPRGNLQSYLHKNDDLLSWARDKIHMAVAIAQALEYLHGRSIIHRDLKSNNILLTAKLEPKLIDFGVSRGILDLTMTAGVGTPYWTAPEILEGKRYTEQADIYSFGVVLTELDTGKTPYCDAVTEGGGKAKPFQILQDVMAGTLRPSFSPDCPPRIQRVGLACLAFDPLMRPTTRQLIQELEGNAVDRVYSF
jgi:mitogen-activated protein kinase kinase kinase 7